MDDNESQIRDTLINAMHEGTLIAIYNLPETDDNFNVGYVLAVDFNFILLESIDWDGKIFGIDAIRIDSIHELATETDYLETVSVKMSVAQRRGYYDLWHVEDFLQGHPEVLKGDLAWNLLQDSYNSVLPVVVGTKRYQGSDDFEGILSDLNEESLTIDYYNEHDLSSMWRYSVPLNQVAYVRTRGTQAATTSQILRDIFDYRGPQDAD